MVEVKSRPNIHIKIISLYNWRLLQKSPKVNRLLSNISERDAEILYKEFVLYILNVYKSLILHAIKNQKFPRRYPPLNAQYVRYKKMNRMKRGFWQATGFSQVNLNFWKLKGGSYAIGFKRNLIHPFSGEKVYKIHQWVEKGTSKMPARELYWPLARKIQRVIYRIHFRKFIKEKHPEYFSLLD